MSTLISNAKMQERMSPNFKYYEMAKSSTASRQEIDNRPTEEIAERGRLVAIHILEPVRAWAKGKNPELFLSPQSWYRCEELEKFICSKAFKAWCEKKKLDANDPESWNAYFKRKSHPKGEAVDIEFPGISNLELFKFIRDNLEFDQLFLECYKPGDPSSGWVHVSFKAEGNRQYAKELPEGY